MKIRITSLGCRLNQSEIESVSTSLQEAGHTVAFNGTADIYIINACAVTSRSERKTRQLIYRAMELCGEADPRRIIVTGCAGEEIKHDGNITYVSNDRKYLIPELVAGMETHDIELHATSRFDFHAPVKCSTNRVNLKIQDGCNNYCSYCIIPQMRGAPVSRPAADILREFRELLDHDYREIILTGVNIGKYNDSGKDLGSLVEQVLAVEGGFRLHLTSLDPESATGKLTALFTHQKMVKHLHLSLQSGSDTVLKRMNRPYNSAMYMDTVHRLKKADGLFNFTTDIIVGFPGETDAEFEDTVNIVKSVPFSHVHTFRYSPRPGTAATAMPGAIHESVKTLRSERIIKLYTQQKIDYYARFSGRACTMLTEKVRDGMTTGYNEYYVPVVIDEKPGKNKFIQILTEPDSTGLRLKGRPAAGSAQGGVS
ncbi:MAG TPA: tRNA (N(6)-L-threonylcarbamoyladenosine(37)-C(2))-methylthiotransferase MtaB [Spirochaetota bacterium]|nr:tRNA (N(6)-L-threonylcarbamoyladenosine(37)-C(2))-methylthiotransferase MtaB [Spirochaetota bacterium]